MIGSAQTAVAGAEARTVVAWRRRQLSAAGFSATLAQSLARDRQVDLHALLGLVDRGCPPVLAARILAPLEEEEEEERA